MQCRTTSTTITNMRTATTIITSIQHHHEVRVTQAGALRRTHQHSHDRGLKEIREIIPRRRSAIGEEDSDRNF